MAGRNQTWGRTRVRVGGETLLTAGKCSIQPGGVKRNAVAADFKTGLYTEEDMDAQIKCEQFVNGSFSIERLRAIVDATIVFECDTGETYVMNGAYLMEPPELSDGKAPLTFVGESVEELSL